MRRALRYFLALVVMVATVATAAPVALADEVVDSADSTPITLDTRTGPRKSDGSETLAYSLLWAESDATSLTILQDGEPVVSGLTGESTYEWNVSYDGTYELTLMSDTGAELGTATFIVTGKGPAPAATHVLTITYEYKDGSQAAPTRTQTVEEGATYSVASPDIKGYQPSIATVSGTMGNADVSVTVTYTAVSDKTDKSTDKTASRATPTTRTSTAAPTARSSSTPLAQTDDASSGLLGTVSLLAAASAAFLLLGGILRRRRS